MHRALLAVTVVVSAVAVWLLWFRDAPVSLDPSPAEVSEPGEVLNHAPAPIPPVGDDGVSSARARSAAGDDPRREEAFAEDDAPAPAELAEIRGRFLLPGGAPASGVSLQTHGWQADSGRVLKYGVPEDWTDPTGISSDDGSFSIRFAPPRAYQFTLDASLAGYPEESWRWGEIEQGSVVDVGDVTLRAGGSIRGRVVSKAGDPQKGFRVYANGPRPEGEGRDRTRVSVRANDATGEFLLESMPAGPVELTANSDLANWIDGPTVTVVAGQEIQADIIYGGPDNSRRITVVTFVRPFFTETVESETIHLYGPNGLHRTAVHIPGSSQSESFEDLPPGTYSIEVVDPRFLPWRKDGVQVGSRVDAHLQGSAAIALRVVDPETGAPVPEYGLRVELMSSHSSPNVFELLAAGGAPPAEGHFAGLVPGDYRLIVTAEGFAETRLDVDGIQPNETRSAQVEMSRGVRLSGVVVAGDVPVEGVAVSLRAPERRQFGAQPQIAEAVSDASGRFELSDVPPGTWTIVARQSAMIGTEPAPITLVAGEEPTELRLELPASGRFTGRVSIDPEAAGLAIEFVPADPDAQDPFEYWGSDDLRCELDAEGRFSTGALLYGKYQAALCTPDVAMQLDMSSTMTMEGVHRPLGVFVLDQPVVDLGTVQGVPFGSLSVRVVEEGRGAAGATVQIVEVTNGADDGAGQGLIAAATDDQGWARVPLVPAGDWSVYVSRVGQAWSTKYPSPVRVAEATTTDIVLQIDFYTHPLTFIDAESNEPMADETLALIIDFGSTSMPHEFQTDAAGAATLRLPPGKVMVQWYETGETWVMKRGAVEWTASGPQPAVMTLKKVDW